MIEGVVDDKVGGDADGIVDDMIEGDELENIRSLDDESKPDESEHEEAGMQEKLGVLISFLNKLFDIETKKYGEFNALKINTCSQILEVFTLFFILLLEEESCYRENILEYF